MMAAPMSRSDGVVGLHRQLPHQVIGQRAGGRERVLDRRQLLDFLRRLAGGSRRRDSRRRSTRSPGRPRCRSCWAAVRVRISPGSGAASAGWRSSVGTSSSIGFSTISWFRRSDSSSVDIGSSLIACCSDGVRISFWTSFVCSFCWMPMRAFSVESFRHSRPLCNSQAHSSPIGTRSPDKSGGPLRRPPGCPACRS